MCICTEGCKDQRMILLDVTGLTSAKDYGIISLKGCSPHYARTHTDTHTPAHTHSQA